VPTVALPQDHITTARVAQPAQIFVFHGRFYFSSVLSSSTLGVGFVIVRVSKSVSTCALSHRGQFCEMRVLVLFRRHFAALPVLSVNSLACWLLCVVPCRFSLIACHWSWSHWFSAGTSVCMACVCSARGHSLSPCPPTPFSLGPPQPSVFLQPDTNSRTLSCAPPLPPLRTQTQMTGSTRTPRLVSGALDASLHTLAPGNRS
jgi:hypothetical protein